MSRMQRVFSFLLTAVAACGGTQTDTSEQSQGGDPSTLTNGALVEDLRIGGLDGPIETTFGSISAIRPIPGGGFHIADLQGPLVRRYDDDGRYQGDLGQIGEGPGEFMDVAAIATLTDGRTLIADQRTGRVTFYGQDGDHLSEFPFLTLGRGYDLRANLETGDIYTMARSADGQFREGQNTSPGDWVRVDLDGQVERLRPITPEDRVGPSFVLSGAQGMYPYTTMTLGAYGGWGDYWEVRNDTNRILHVHADGSESHIELDGPKLELTAGEYDQWVGRAEHMAQRPDVDRSQLFPIPRVKPYVRDMAVDSDGRLWVLRYAEPVFVAYSDEQKAEREAQGLPDHNWRDRHIWEVYDRNDRLLGRVELPPTVGFYDALGAHVYGVELGDYREHYAVRYRLTRAEFEGG